MLHVVKMIQARRDGVPFRFSPWLLAGPAALLVAGVLVMALR